MKFWFRVKTFFRIQWRLFLLFLADIFLVVERPLCVLVNWFLLLTAPLWIGVAYIVMYCWKAWQSRKNVERSVLSGKVWYWDSFRLY